MVDYNSTIPTFDQIEGNTLLQKMREMYDVLSENIKSEGAITKVKFENGIIEFSNEESTIASVDLSGVVINANLEGNSIVFTKIDNSKFSVSLEGLITDETAVLESRVDNLDDELNNVSSELATISSKTDNLESDNTTNKEKISTLETDNTSNKEKISSLESDNTSNKQRISTLETDNTTNKGKISSLESDNTSNKQRISTLETDNTSNKQKISTLETNVNKAFINASFETQTSILTLTALDGSSVKVTIPSGGGSGGGNVSDVIYDDVSKTITVNYVTGEPKVYTLTQLVSLDSNLNSINTNIQEIETKLDSNLNSINTNIQEIETNLEELQTETYKSFINASFNNETSTLTLTAIDNSHVDVIIPSNSEKIVKDVTYNNENKTITVTYSEGEPNVYTLTELIGLTDKLNTFESNINSNTEKITLLETFQSNYTPKIDNSFVNATKTNDTTLRLTRNDGTMVDINFPKGLSVRTLTGQNIDTLKSNANELVVINSCIITGYGGGSAPNSQIYVRGGLGYLKETNATSYSSTDVADGVNRILVTKGSSTTVKGLLYNGSYVSHE